MLYLAPQGRLSEAVQQYLVAATLCPHRELKLLSLHELAWCRLANLQIGWLLNPFLPTVPTFAVREKQSLGQQMLELSCENATVGKNGLTSFGIMEDQLKATLKPLSTVML